MNPSNPKSFNPPSHQASDQPSLQLTAPTSPAPVSAGCYVGCGDKAACDEECIRELAARQCRASCGVVEKVSTPAHGLCAEEGCCGAVIVVKQDKSGASGVIEMGVGCGDEREDCCGGKDRSKLVEKKGCCSDDRDNFRVEGQDTCSARKEVESNLVKEPCCDGDRNLDSKSTCCSSDLIPNEKKQDCGNDKKPGSNEVDGLCSAEKSDDAISKENAACCSNVKDTTEAVGKGGCCTQEASKIDSITCCGGKEDKSQSQNEGNCYSDNLDGLQAERMDCCSDKKQDSTEVKDACCSDKLDNLEPKKQTSCCSSKTLEPEVMEKESCCSKKQENQITKKETTYYTDKTTDSAFMKGNGCNKKGDCCASSSDCDSDTTTNKKGSIFPSGESKPKSTTGACAAHLQKAFNEYHNYLEKGRCICRSVLNRIDARCGQPSPPKQPVDKVCISTRASTGIASPQRQSSRCTAKQACEKSCCDTIAVRSTLKESENSCALEDNMIVFAPQNLPYQKVKEVDLEDSAARQHVFLGVSGMTCTGCSKKLTNVLNNVQGISSIKVTFVTGVAEFDLDLAVASVQQVIPRIEKETGFKFSQIESNYQALDLRFESGLDKHQYDRLQNLVENIEKVNESTYLINYDPLVIGARTLLSSIEGASLAPPSMDSSLADGRRRLLKLGWATAAAAALTIPIVVLAWSDNPVPYSTRSIVSLVLATLVQGIAVPEFYVGAVKSLIYSRVLEMDMLVVISITAAYGYSVVAFGLTHAGLTLETGEFFETGALLVTLILLGRLVAAIAKLQAVSAVSLRSLQAEKAMLVEGAESTTEIDARLLQFGDSFVVPAHSRIVTDGEVILGQSSVDESMITGENVPVSKTIGDEVIAGTINGPSALTIRMTRLPGKNSITDIANLVENALSAKPRIQDLADKVAGYFIPVVMSIALVVFAIWMAVGTKIRGKNGGGAVGLAISYSITVLAVSCPCALGLAVPMVLVIAGGVAARSGVIIKQADAIERGYKVTDVVFDKTGTITKGDLEVVHQGIFRSAVASENDVISLARSLTKDNQHPVSMAVAAKLQAAGDVLTDQTKVESIPGSGISCLWKSNVTVKAGNPYWLNIENKPEIATLIDQGMTLFCITINSEPIAAFGLKSSIRNEALSVMTNLQRRNITCHILSGDGPRVVEDVAHAVGIRISNIASRHSPAEKQQYVKTLMDSGKHVLFCGDGTNDAVAVAQANVGVQIGTTSDVTRATADVVLLGGLDGILVLLDLSKRSFRRIMFNFVWAAVYNVFAILLASGAFVKVRIPPAYAGLGEIVSVVPVIVVAVSLSRSR